MSFGKIFWSGCKKGEMLSFLFVLFVIGSGVSCSKGSPLEEMGSFAKGTPKMDGVSFDAADSERTANPVVFELLMNEFIKSANKWSELDPFHKREVIRGFIAFLATSDKAKIQKPADFYINRIDAMVADGGNVPHNIPTLLKIVAVMEYDYDIGRDKDQLAKEILGPQLYEANKTRRETAAK